MDEKSLEKPKFTIPRLLTMKRKLIYSLFLFLLASNVSFAQQPSQDAAGELGLNKILSGIVAFLSTVAVLLVICMPSRKN